MLDCAVAGISVTTKTGEVAGTVGLEAGCKVVSGASVWGRVVGVMKPKG